ncbi:MAG: glycosyltransferase family 4 protein [Candidatus Paceibacterota bacterium]|jgi:glycosyltransferase involved in cell wall biosynthesis
MKKVAYIFTNSREATIRNLQTGQVAGTSLYGLNHFTGVHHFTIPPKSIRALLFIPRLLRYDFVIAQDNLLLGYIVSWCSYIFRLRTRWFYIAINSSTLMKRHAQRPLHLFLLKKLWSSYARIVCLSLEQFDDFVKLGISKKNLAFVPFGVDISFFKVANEDPEENLIVSVGRDAGRDYLTLFKVAEQVPHQFVIVASLKNIPSDRPIPPNVTVLYDKSLAEIRDLYRRAKLVVVVSKDANVPDGSDCSGQTVVLDALAAGKTVIATYRPWIIDYFTPNKDLVVVEPSNHETLSEEIKTLWQDSQRCKLLATSGHDKVITNYTTKTFAKSLLEIMNSFV